MAYKGKFHPKNPEKYKGNAGNIIWRSTWECRYMHWLDDADIVKTWSSEEVVIPYKDPVKGVMRRYFVDFYVEIEMKDGTTKKYLIEIKPKSQVLKPVPRKRMTRRFVNEVMEYGTNQAKWAAATAYCQNRGWEFKILTEDDLGIVINR